MSLKIIIAGAGIAGLVSGIALRQAGHDVEVRQPFACPSPARIVDMLANKPADIREVKVRDRDRRCIDAHSKWQANHASPFPNIALMPLPRCEGPHKARLLVCQRTCRQDGEVERGAWAGSGTHG